MASLCGNLIAELVHPRLAFIDHFAAVSAGIRTDLDDVIRCGDDILIVLYYDKGLYADCGMEFYYIAMTVYGFVNWKFLKGKAGAASDKKELPVTHFKRSLIMPWTIATLAIWGIIWWLLATQTDSSVPIADSFTTALSFVGMWALARKYLEQWLIWIAVDVVTCALYIYKDIPFKASLYGLYVVIAILGFVKWRKMMHQKLQ